MTTESEIEKSLDNVIFRVKTSKEMLKEFGDNWEDDIFPSWHKDMNVFFGTIVPNRFKRDCFKVMVGENKAFRMCSNVTVLYSSNWYFSKEMIKCELI